MRTIEPCCAKRHWRELRDAIGQDDKTQFQGYGDMSLTELLPALLTRYAETEMLLSAPSLPDQAADIILRWMRKQWARMDGTGKLDVITRLTIIADLSPSASPVASAWLADNPFPDRLVLIDTSARGITIAPEDTALLLPDIAITGPLNLRYGQNFTCTATTKPDEVQALWHQHQEAAKAEKADKPAKAAKKPAKTKAAVPALSSAVEPAGVSAPVGFADGKAAPAVGSVDGGSTAVEKQQPTAEPQAENQNPDEQTAG